MENPLIIVEFAANCPQFSCDRLPTEPGLAVRLRM